MTGRGVGRSPLEMIAIRLALVVMVGVGLLWGTGVVIGSILGSVLLGSGGNGVAAVLAAFPNVGMAWDPAIPSGLIWGASLSLVAVFAPLIWRLIRQMQLPDEGAQWAAMVDLGRAGLLVADRTLPNAEEEEEEEEPSDA